MLGIESKMIMNFALKLGLTFDNVGIPAGFYLPEEDRSTRVTLLAVPSMASAGACQYCFQSKTV